MHTYNCRGRLKISSSSFTVAHLCTHCNGTGYKGRFVVAAVHTLNMTLRDMMIARSSLSQMEVLLHDEHHPSLWVQAMRYVEQGITSEEEVLRVIGAQTT